jgi:serine protease AprX
MIIAFKTTANVDRPQRRARISAHPLISMAALALVFSFGLSGTSASAAAGGKFSPDLLRELQADPAGATVGIAGAVKGATPSAASTRKHKILIRVDNSLPGNSLGLGSKFFSKVHMHSVSATAKQIIALSANTHILSLSLDRKITASSTTDVPLDVNPVSVGADVAGEQVSGNPTLIGSGVTVAVIDSGVSPVDDIRGHIVGFHDFIGGRQQPYDDYGHGTHVAGIVAGDGTDSSGSGAFKKYRGIAPGANIVGVKVLDSQGNGSASGVIAGLDWCIAHKSEYGIRVINLSITGPVMESYTTDPVCQAAEQAVAAGIVVVVSAGNQGGRYGYIGSPANDPAVVTVGASNSLQTPGRSDDKITTYTSRGPTRVDGVIKPDLIAPGNKVVSLRVPGSTADINDAWTYVDPSEYLSGSTIGVESSYARMSGTSMSAPAVAGAVAILLQENAGLTPNAVKLALMYSAQIIAGYDPVLKATVVYDPFTQGAGELNIPGAVQIASQISSSGLSGTLDLTSAISGENCPWFGAQIGQLLTWAHGSLSNSFFGNSGVWSSAAVWGGDQLTWGGDQLTWGGDQLTWGGDQLTWGGDQLTWGGDQLTWGGDQLTWGGDQLTWGGDQLTWGGDQLTWGGDQLTWGGDQLTWGGDQLTWGGD